MRQRGMSASGLRALPATGKHSSQSGGAAHIRLPAVQYEQLQASCMSQHIRLTLFELTGLTSALLQSVQSAALPLPTGSNT